MGAARHEVHLIAKVTGVRNQEVELNSGLAGDHRRIAAAVGRNRQTGNVRHSHRNGIRNRRKAVGAVRVSRAGLVRNRSPARCLRGALR